MKNKFELAKSLNAHKGRTSREIQWLTFTTQDEAN